MSAPALVLEGQARSLEHVVADQTDRLAGLRALIETLIPSNDFDAAANQALSSDQVELSISALDSEIATSLAPCLVPRQIHTRLASCCRYVDMLHCADRIRSLAKALDFRHATPFVNSLPTLEEWLLSQRNAGVSEDDLRLRIADFQHRIKLMQRRFKGVPGLYQIIGPRFREAALVREKVQTVSGTMGAVRGRLTSLVDTNKSVLSRLEPAIAATTESLRSAEIISERISAIRKVLQHHSDKAKYYGLLKADLDRANRLSDEFHDVFHQWETSRAQSKSCFWNMTAQLKAFAEELEQAKADLSKIISAGPSFSDLRSKREAERTVLDAFTLTKTLNDIQEANRIWKQQKKGAADGLLVRINRLQQAHARLIASAERYLATYRAARSVVLQDWADDRFA